MNKITIMGMSDKVHSLNKDSSPKIILRTKISDVAEILEKKKIQFTTLDYIYEDAENFNSLDKLLADEVIKSAQEIDVCYLVPGSAVALDGSVNEIFSRYSNVEILAGIAPEYDLLAACKQSDASCGYSIIPASCLEVGLFSSRIPLIVSALDNEYLLSDVKILLSEEYGDEHEILVGSFGVYSKMPLFELDRHTNCDHNTMMYIPVKSDKSRYDMIDLEGIFKKLRSPEGCPWDREQNHVSLKRYLLEECAEVLDAIDSGDMHELCDELGDVLLQVIFHATIAAERGDFDMRDVSDNLARKLVKRHPHVFSDESVQTSSEVKKLWDEIKQEDKQDATISAKLNSVPKSMTALMRAQKVFSIINKSETIRENHEYYCDDDISKMIKNMKGYYNQLNSAMKKKQLDQCSVLLGEILLQTVHMSRILDVEAELTLQNAVKEFVKRIISLEKKTE
ncbi:MAG: MazG family protein [Clostridiales bacterium]|nr:MazG family protein [Clostridiales bacterium]